MNNAIAWIMKKLTGIPTTDSRALIVAKRYRPNTISKASILYGPYDLCYGQCSASKGNELTSEELRAEVEKIEKSFRISA